MPDGRIISIPIPDPLAPTTYADWQVADLDAAQLVNDLTRGKITPQHHMHLDPDLRHDALSSRPPAWQPLFGQHGAAGGHLLKQNVSVGDLFMFFGWFREVEQHRGCWRFKKNAPDIHVLHGWLKVAAHHCPLPDQPPDWMKHHPHFYGDREPNNMLYVAAANFPSDNAILPGAGHFNFLKKELVLTKPGEKRGIWQLPACFYPKTQAQALTYHRNLSRWQPQKQQVILDSVKRGQEFVVEITRANRRIQDWTESLIKTETLQSL